jgi:hypothetical protein
MLWPNKKRGRYDAVRERMISEEGKRMHCIRGARAAHQAMRAEGRIPGAEGRAVIEANRKARKAQACIVGQSTAAKMAF